MNMQNLCDLCRMSGTLEVFDECVDQISAMFLIIEIQTHQSRMNEKSNLFVCLFKNLQHLIQVIITVVINRRRVIQFQSQMNGVDCLLVKTGSVF